MLRVPELQIPQGMRGGRSVNSIRAAAAHQPAWRHDVFSYFSTAEGSPRQGRRHAANQTKKHQSSLQASKHYPKRYQQQGLASTDQKTVKHLGPKDTLSIEVDRLKENARKDWPHRQEDLE